jgi:hypothetical protein
MTTKGFTKIDNLIIFDRELSLEALGLYVKVQHLASIDNFKIQRNYIKSISGYGETAFRRVWKELKDKGILLETKTINKGRYEYSYTLKTNHITAKVNAPEEENIKHVDSDGNAPITGQVHINEVLVEEKEELPEEVEENIKAILEATGFNKFQATELLMTASNDVIKVISCYDYTVSQSDVKNIFNYTKWAIKNNKLFNTSTVPKECKKTNFADYEQRTYDFGKLEKALLYGEQYELPA